MIHRAALFQVCVAGLTLIGCLPPVSELGWADYSDVDALACPIKIEESAGYTDGLKSGRGIAFNVRTPRNYRADVAHPLLVVYSPGDRDVFATERFTGLTTDFTAAGYIVAYADNRPRGAPSSWRPISKEWIHELGTIPGVIADRWCIDTERVFLTGHSNGGTVATALAILPDSGVRPTAIVASAAGFNGSDLAELDCPERPLPVMVMHSVDDRLFPDFGRQAVKWWAKCNGCEAPTDSGADGCDSYSACADNVATKYCAGTGHHRKWPGKNEALLEFVSGVG